MNIKKARKQKKLKQKELAEQIGYTESSISKYEQGLIQIPNTIINEIARVLDVSPLQLLGADEWDKQFNQDEKLSMETRLLEHINEIYGSKSVELLRWFNELNELGQEKAVNDLCDMTEIPKYKK